MAGMTRSRVTIPIHRLNVIPRQAFSVVSLLLQISQSNISLEAKLWTMATSSKLEMAIGT